MSLKIGVLLAGCGPYDGTDIHEAVLTLLFLDRAGAVAHCMAPDVVQRQVIDHLTLQLSSQPRMVLAESARIARGDIQDVAQVQAIDISGLIIPGGFGTANHLSDFAINGPDGDAHPEVKRLLVDMLAAGKPIGAAGIAAATVVRALAGAAPLVTVGTDTGIAAGIERMGGTHCDCGAAEIVVDEAHHIVTTPSYMLSPTINEVASGIAKLVDKILVLCRS